MPPRKDKPNEIPKHIRDAFEGQPETVDQAVQRLSLALHAMMEGKITPYQHQQVVTNFKVMLPALQKRDEDRASMDDLSPPQLELVSHVASRAAEWVRGLPDGAVYRACDGESGPGDLCVYLQRVTDEVQS